MAGLQGLSTLGCSAGESGDPALWVLELGISSRGDRWRGAQTLLCAMHGLKARRLRARGVQWAEQHCHAGTSARTGGIEAGYRPRQGCGTGTFGECWRLGEGSEGAQSPVCALLPHLSTEIPPAVDPGCKGGRVGREAGAQPARQQGTAEVDVPPYPHR